MKRKLTDKQLHAAFDLVKDAKNWKNPINAVIDAKDQDAVSQAVIYFTGSVPGFTPMKNGKVRVRSVGYYVAIGA